MQSGISVSQELHDAFNELVSSFPVQRGIIVTIKNEQLVPAEIIRSSSLDFYEDINVLESIIMDNEAAYIILRQDHNAPDSYIAVTYVPDSANVRSKMLFASTRLTMVRELGTERFRETLFVTTKSELTADGWRKHDMSSEPKAPLTDEEQNLKDIKEAEAEASQGTTARSNHYTPGRLTLPISMSALQVLRDLPSGSDNLVQLRLKYEGNNVSIELAGTSSTDADNLATAIFDQAPRYSFFRYTAKHDVSEQSPIIFIYTCPPSSKIKERMVYASSRAFVIAMAGHEAGIEITKKLEASNPSEINASTIHEEFHPKMKQKQGFSRPKRPGKR